MTCGRCCGGCCCPDDDSDRVEVYYVASSAAPAIGNIQTGNCAVGGVSVVYQNSAIGNSNVSNVVVASDAEHPVKDVEDIDKNHI